MNAVILLVWLAGADGAAPAAKPLPGHAPPASVSVAPNSACNDCCDSGGHRLLGKLRGLFHRCDDGCKSSCGPHGQFHQRHQDTSCNQGGHKLFGAFHGTRQSDCCEESWHSKLRGRLHGVFRKHDDCCPNNCGTTAVPAVIHPQPALAPAPLKQPAKPLGEKIAPPKAPEKLPKAGLGTQPPSVFSLQPPVLNEQR